MKLLHLSDLHLGLKICEISMLDEQRYVFEQVFDCIKEHHIDAVLISGDVYDKSIPPVDAVKLFDEILFRLSEMNVPILIISGNHDSAERLSFGARVMSRQRIWVVTNVKEALEPVTLRDEYGDVNFYLLPFLRPSDVNNAFSQSIAGYTEAIRFMIEQMKVDPAKRNVMLAHQFVSGASVSDSELTVGGTDCVDRAVFDVFDYAALGHLHTPQRVGKDTVRYCGTPLKYSLSEIGHQKSMTIVTLGEKTDITLDTVPFVPQHEMRKLKGSYRELMEGTPSEDYLYVELTNNDDVPYAASGLRQIYPNLISLSYLRNNRSGGETVVMLNAEDEKTPEEIFEELFMQQHPDSEITELQHATLRDMIEQVWR